MTRAVRPHRGHGGRGGHEPQLRIRRREQEAVRLSTEGRSQHEIAHTLAITQPAVSQILRRVDERWARENQDRVAQHKAEQARKLDHLYRQAIGAWERSKAQRTRRRQRQSTPTDAGQTGGVAEVIVDDSHGDARYLEAARHILADLARLWGTAGSTAHADPASDAPAVFTLVVGDERTAPRFDGRTAPRQEGERS